MYVYDSNDERYSASNDCLATVNLSLFFNGTNGSTPVIEALTWTIGGKGSCENDEIGLL